MKTKLELLRATVLAKAAFWDALRELEKGLAGDDFTDRANDEVIGLVESLATGLNSDDATCVTDDHVAMVEQIVKVYS